MSELSPLFALDAENFIKEGKYSDAIELCMNGIEQFPDYAMGYRMLIRAYAESKEYDNALEWIEKAKGIFPGDKFFKEFSDKIENLISDAKNESQEISTNNEDFVESSNEVQDDDTNAQEEELEEPEDENMQLEDDNQDIDSDLNVDETSESNDNDKNNAEEENEFDNTTDISTDIFDEQIEAINYEYTEPKKFNSNNLNLIPGFKINSLEASNLDAQHKILEYSKLQKEQLKRKPVIADQYAKIAYDLKQSNINEKESIQNITINQNNLKTNVISDTLASIYYRQGALEQALEAYKKLYDSDPSEKYEKMVNEIEEKINSGK